MAVLARDSRQQAASPRVRDSSATKNNGPLRSHCEEEVADPGVDALTARLGHLRWPPDRSRTYLPRHCILWLRRYRRKCRSATFAPRGSFLALPANCRWRRGRQPSPIRDAFAQKCRSREQAPSYKGMAAFQPSGIGSARKRMPSAAATRAMVMKLGLFSPDRAR